GSRRNHSRRRIRAPRTRPSGRRPLRSCPPRRSSRLRACRRQRFRRSARRLHSRFPRCRRFRCHPRPPFLRRSPPPFQCPPSSHRPLSRPSLPTRHRSPCPPKLTLCPLARQAVPHFARTPRHRSAIRPTAGTKILPQRAPCPRMNRERPALAHQRPSLHSGSDATFAQSGNRVFGPNVLAIAKGTTMSIRPSRTSCISSTRSGLGLRLLLSLPLLGCACSSPSEVSEPGERLDRDALPLIVPQTGSKPFAVLRCRYPDDTTPAGDIPTNQQYQQLIQTAFNLWSAASYNT